MAITLADIYKQSRDIPTAVAFGDALEVLGIPYVVAEVGYREIVIINPLTGRRLTPIFTAKDSARITQKEFETGLSTPFQVNEQPRPLILLDTVIWLGRAHKVFIDCRVQEGPTMKAITLADIYKQGPDIPTIVAVGDVLEIANVPYLVTDAGPQAAALNSLVTGSRVGSAFTVRCSDEITRAELEAGPLSPIRFATVTWLGPTKKVFGRIDQKEN